MGIDLQPAANGAHVNGTPGVIAATGAILEKRYGLFAEACAAAKLHDTTPLEIKFLGVEDRFVAAFGLAPPPAFTIPFLDPVSVGFIRFIDEKGKQHPFFCARIFDHHTDRKYVQPPASGCHLYYPPGPDWALVMPDPTIDAAFAEGPMKALVAWYRAKLIVLGLCGLDNISCPEIDDARWVWKGRRVTFYVDSDCGYNGHSLGAIWRFVKKMRGLGAKPEVIILPGARSGKKIGLDDLLMEHGPSGLALCQSVNLTAFEKCEEFLDWVDDHILVKTEPPLVFVRSEKRLRRLESVHAECNKWTDAGAKAPKLISHVWQHSALRPTAPDVAYEPQRENPRPDAEVARLNDGRINLWPGWGSQSIKGDVTLWQKHLDWLFLHEHEKRTWFERWCAYPIRHPGTKLYTAAILIGRHGAGKSLTGYILGSVYGAANFSEIGQEDLDSPFNEFAKHKQFILADEICKPNEKRLDADFIKRVVTRQTIHINVKMQPVYEIRDTINYLFTSNKGNAIYIEDGERRYFVHKIDRVMPEELAREIDVWYRSPAGIAALRYYFEHLDLGDFNPKAPALETEDREAMIEAGRSDLDRFALDFYGEPPAMLALIQNSAGRELWALQELGELAGLRIGKQANGTALSNALVRAGFKQTHSKVHTCLGRIKLFITGNVEKWLAADNSEISAVFNAAHPETPRKF